MNPELISIIAIVLILALWTANWMYANQAKPVSLDELDRFALVEQLRLISLDPSAIVEAWPDEEYATIEVETASKWSIVFICEHSQIIGVESATTPDGHHSDAIHLTILRTVDRAALASAVYARMAELGAQHATEY